VWFLEAPLSACGYADIELERRLAHSLNCHCRDRCKWSLGESGDGAQVVSLQDAVRPMRLAAATFLPLKRIEASGFQPRQGISWLATEIVITHGSGFAIAGLALPA
jgi:hypothetical protein